MFQGELTFKTLGDTDENYDIKLFTSDVSRE